ncbi:RICIN domain-containing protein [Plantactinospora soyae]|uniref:Ricin B lectin domain-containing protein n=1 Tax=Plantactinospora soyae TaxID=1544732 RepID=A0A927R6Y1_9ACTN|nr:RICIN domain-containing protein [Plantactinospora soyae]MBE1488909.1 hypothetical protein [Plantactinospora soyae]
MKVRSLEAGRRSGGLRAHGLVLVLLAAALVGPTAPASAAITPAAGVPILGASSNLCLNVERAAVTNNARVIQYTCSATATNDDWKAVSVGDGTYHITAIHSNMCLNVSAAATVNNVAIVQFTCSATGKNDNFRFRSVPGSHTFQLVAEHSGKCLHVAGASTAPGAAIVQFTCGTVASAYERWYFPPTGGVMVSPPQEPFTPISVIQAAPEAGATQAPLTYAYVDNLGRLLHGHQSDPDAFGNLQWTVIGEGEEFSGQPLLSYQADGRVQMIGHNSVDGDTWLRTQTTKGLPQWNAFQDVGGSNLSHPAVGRLPDGKLVVFTLVNGGLWHLPQDGVQSPYLGWRFVGGTGLVGRPTVVTIRDGLQVFAADAAGALHTATYRGGTLSDWISLGGSGLTGAPSVVVFPGFRPRVFARAADGAIVTKGQDATGAFGTVWEPVGDFAAAGPPAAVLNPISGLTEVIARGSDGVISYVTETAQASGAWGTWRPAVTSGVLAATEPTIVTFTRYGGETWAFAFRTEVGAPFIFVRENLDPMGRGTTGPGKPFTEVRLPAPPE